ncbi:glycoside hydrolase, partial [Priestia aryabhattai]
MTAVKEQIQPPSFPNRTFNIKRYGAAGDGKSDSTAAFKKAIEAANKAGGGRVVVPPGTYVTGAIYLKSNVNLHVMKKATIKFSQNPDKYLPAVLTRWEGVELYNYSPLIYAYNEKNIAITGEGTLDGQGDNEHWWPWKGKKEFGWKEGEPNQQQDRDLLFKMAEEK